MSLNNERCFVGRFTVLIVHDGVNDKGAQNSSAWRNISFTNDKLSSAFEQTFHLRFVGLFESGIVGFVNNDNKDLRRRRID